MANCKISICVPTYNYGAYLPETIDSILSQSFTDFELIIVDDNSRDDTRAVGERYARRDPRIRFSVNAENIGMVRNWNRCLEMARGEYVKFVFGDDRLHSPDALRRMAEVLDARRSVSLVASARNFIDQHSRLLKVDANFREGVYPGTMVIGHCLKSQSNPIGEPSVVMFRKKDAGRGFLPNYRHLVDLEMWFHLLEQGAFAYLEEPLCSFRIHDRQATKSNRESSLDVLDTMHLLDDYLPKGYLECSPLTRGFIVYDHLYRVVKLQRRGGLSREEALGQLRRYRYTPAGFAGRYPFYKLLKPCLKLCKRLSKGRLPSLPSVDPD